MFRSRLKTILIVMTTFLTLVIITPALAIWSFSDDLDAKLEAKKILQPTEFVTPLLLLQTGERWNSESLSRELSENAGFRKRAPDQPLLANDFFYDESKTSFVVTRSNGESYLIQLQGETIHKIVHIESKTEVSYLPLGEKVVAQYVNKQPLLQRNSLIGEFPTQCLNAVIAIEDNNFLEHKGVSYMGIARAIIKNLLTLKRAQGGSTITQQLVKNYFLTPEKTLTRKFNEFFLAMNLESKFTKDQILETYLNIIYMGQSGAFQIHGFGAASEYYFDKKVSDLNLPECALLAAIINNPGLNNPWKNPKQADSRRKLVLNKMKAQGFIADAEFADATTAALPSKPKPIPNETAPYFIDAAIKQVQQLGITPEGHKILLSLNLEHQSVAQNTLQTQLNELENSKPILKKLKEKNVRLEAALLSTDNTTGIVTAGVGGRNFKNSQFNRLTEARRQIGSLVKPFVYLTAIHQGEFSPDKSLENTKFTVEYDRQKWSPDNYDKSYSDPVPAYIALKNSLNIPAARLTMAVGIKNVIETLYQFGFSREIPALPSISLGSFEQTLLAVLEAYSSIATFGNKPTHTFVLGVFDSNQNQIFKFVPRPQLIFSQTETSLLVSLMKQTNLSGTAKLIGARQFPIPSAGKTGTTNDYKDAWYIGFTPRTTTLVWVGFDQNQSHGLTGGSAAVPAWYQYMNATQVHSPTQDWQWPANTEVKKIPSADSGAEIDLLFLKK